MKLDLTEIYSERVDKMLRDNEHERIKVEALASYGEFETLTIGELSNCLDDNFGRVIGDRNERIRGSWLQVYWCKAFVEWANGLADRLKALTYPMDEDEQKASSDLMESTLIEAMLVFARNYFGLHSFTEAEKIQIGEVLIAKKAVYNETVFRKRLAKIQLAKAKKK